MLIWLGIGCFCCGGDCEWLHAKRRPSHESACAGHQRRSNGSSYGLCSGAAVKFSELTLMEGWAGLVQTCKTLLCSPAMATAKGMWRRAGVCNAGLQSCKAAMHFWGGGGGGTGCNRNPSVARPCHTLSMRDWQGQAHLYSAYTQPLEQGAEHLRDGGQDFAAGTEAGKGFRASILAVGDGQPHAEAAVHLAEAPLHLQGSRSDACCASRLGADGADA